MENNIYEDIIKNFKELEEYHIKIANHKQYNNDSYDDTPIEVIYEFDMFLLESSLEKKFTELYKYSQDNGFYYFDCPSKVYIKEFDKRREKFFKTNIDAKEYEFLIDEIEYLTSPKINRVIGDNPVFNYDNYITEPKKYKFSLQRKIDFISEKLNRIGFKVNFSEPEVIYDSFYKTETILEPHFNIEPLEKNDTNSPITENPNTSTSKLKTDLSVPQLSLLFKMINDLKPAVFKTESNAELFRFISANFKTKQSSERGISTNKLSNQFSVPDLKAIEFWEKHLHTMLSELRKLK